MCYDESSMNVVSLSLSQNTSLYSTAARDDVR